MSLWQMTISRDSQATLRSHIWWWRSKRINYRRESLNWGTNRIHLAVQVPPRLETSTIQLASLIIQAQNQETLMTHLEILSSVTSDNSHSRVHWLAYVTASVICMTRKTATWAERRADLAIKTRWLDLTWPTKQLVRWIIIHLSGARITVFWTRNYLPPSTILPINSKALWLVSRLLRNSLDWLGHPRSLSSKVTRSLGTILRSIQQVLR